MKNVFPAGWWAVTIKTRGPVAAFPDREAADDHANALRDAIGEARGLTSAVSVVRASEVRAAAAGELPEAIPAVELPDSGPVGTASKADPLGNVFFDVFALPAGDPRRVAAENQQVARLRKGARTATGGRDDERAEARQLGFTALD